MDFLVSFPLVVVLDAPAFLFMAESLPSVHLPYKLLRAELYVSIQLQRLETFFVFKG